MRTLQTMLTEATKQGAIIPASTLNPPAQPDILDPGSSNSTPAKLSALAPVDDFSLDSDDDSDPSRPSLQIDTCDEKTIDDIRAVCIIDEEPYWLVEQIRDVKVDPEGHRHYLVKWVGYPESANSWEPEENCNMASRLVEEFLRRIPEEKRAELARQMLQASRPRAGAIKRPKRKPRKPADGFPAKRRSKAKASKTGEFKKDGSVTDADSSYATGTESGPSTCSSPTTSLG